MEAKNPFIEQENYFAGYDKSIDELKNTPHIIEFDKLCYELFLMNDQGKRFMEIVTERYLLRVSGSPGSPSYTQECMWSDGVRYAFLLLRNSITQHQQRISAGK